MEMCPYPGGCVDLKHALHKRSVCCRVKAWGTCYGVVTLGSELEAKHIYVQTTKLPSA